MPDYNENVWVLIIEYPTGGYEVSVFGDSAVANTQLYNFVCSKWHEEFDAPIPEDEDEAIDEFFDRCSNYYSYSFLEKPIKEEPATYDEDFDNDDRGDRFNFDEEDEEETSEARVRRDDIPF